MLNITELSLMTDKELMSYLSKSIKTKRLENNLMQTELAQKSGVPLGTVRAMERTGKISLSNFIKLLRALDCLDMLNELSKSVPIIDLRQYAKQTKPRQRVKK